MATISDEYSSLGNPKGILQGIDVTDPRERDPVQMCLPGKFMNKAALSNIDNGLCPKFMVNRCANNWDKYCNIYFDQSLNGLNGLDQELFLDQVTDSKFCTLDPTVVGSSNCKIMKQLFDPTMPSSPIVTTTIGNIVYSKEPLSGYQIIEGCPKKCDIVNPNIESEPLFQRCIRNSNKDPCRSVIDNICKLNSEDKFTIKDSKLKELCEQRVKKLNIFTNSIPVKSREGFQKKNLPIAFVSIVVIIGVVLLYLKLRRR